MAEEETPATETVAAASEAAAPDAATNDKAPNGKRNYNKKEETPIEELYDLSQPIPHVARPNKVDHEKNLADLTAEFDALREQRKGLQDQIEAALNKGKGSEVGKLREVLQKLRQQKGKLIDEKKAIRAQLDVIKSASDKIAKDRKDTRSNIQFSSLEQIEAQIKKLQRLQETTSMSLQEEKKLIREVDSLKASKDAVKVLKEKEGDLEGMKEKRKTISQSLSAKDDEINAVQKEIDVKQAEMKELSEKESSKRGEIDALFKERDAIKQAITDKLKEKDAARDDFRERQNKWWNYSRAVRAQKNMQYEAEKKQREDERAAYLKKLEEEEMKKIPYEEEQGLCDYLANYLERTYINTGADDNKADSKKDDIIAVKDDPFANFKPMKKKTEDKYFGLGKGKKKRDRGDRATKKKAAGPFTLNVDTFEQFGLIGLNPPTSVEQVAESIKALREKKQWYKDQPRGSVATAKDIRKANEKTAAKIRQSNQAVVKDAAPKGKFSVSSDEFAPLGKGASNAVDGSSWGQKPAEAPVAVEEEAPPADAEESADVAAADADEES
eukprot:CAMPEP_0119556182 /NCGR_PEP_ID=MMETSP1352-20130426/8198_1 /TAXON_ID=265584 /ORGANISM="Stauroneis constricta, Strain CCMP1120" /LENGTH=554 /DNA_ID=CAMNT_0007603085 /DNA_START=62 /DNA_END=1726 /DNA_ORIENTATION=+